MRPLTAIKGVLFGLGLLILPMKQARAQVVGSDCDPTVFDDHCTGDFEYLACDDEKVKKTTCTGGDLCCVVEANVVGCEQPLSKGGCPSPQFDDEEEGNGCGAAPGVGSGLLGPAAVLGALWIVSRRRRPR